MVCMFFLRDDGCLDHSSQPAYSLLFMSLGWHGAEAVASDVVRSSDRKPPGSLLRAVNIRLRMSDDGRHLIRHPGCSANSGVAHYG